MKKRSKKYLAAKKLIEKGKIYSLEEAIDLLKKINSTKFDASVEVHIKSGIDVKKNETIRGTVDLPHGTGKNLRVCVFAPLEKQKEAKDAGADIIGDEELIKQIKSSKKLDFDVAVATPEMMKSLGQIAKILGQKGLMPNPKDETISPNPSKIVLELKKGRVTFKSDDSGNLHQIIGKVSFDKAELISNFKAFIEAVKKAKPKDFKGVLIQGITLSSSMGPGIRAKE